MKLEIEVKAFGKVEVPGTEDAFQSTEIARLYALSKETTLGELESILEKLFTEIENGYSNPEQCFGKITIRAKKDHNGHILYLG